uniref:Uncharacterized protein n=1 Tax=Globodera pallida TaxID=36090 RepID=A0A183BZZ9_GLOPA
MYSSITPAACREGSSTSLCTPLVAVNRGARKHKLFNDWQQGVPVALFDHLDNPDTCVHIVHSENPLFTNTSSSVVFSTSHAGFINLGNMTNSPKLKQ